MKIGDKIRKIREIKGLEQKEMAEKLNILPQVYSNLERNKTKMDEDRLEQIAKILGISVETIREFDTNKLFINSTPIFGNARDVAKKIINNSENNKTIELLLQSKDELIKKQQEEIAFLRTQIKDLTTKLLKNE